MIIYVSCVGIRVLCMHVSCVCIRVLFIYVYYDGIMTVHLDTRDGYLCIMCWYASYA